MCLGFDSRTQRRKWAEFAGSLLCSESFFSGYSGFMTKPILHKSLIQRIQNDVITLYSAANVLSRIPAPGLDLTTSADVFAFTMNRHAILKALVSSTFIVSL